MKENTCGMTGNQIIEIVEQVEDFVAKVLCPKIEEFGGAKTRRQLHGNISAALYAAMKSVDEGVTKYIKHDGKYIPISEDELPQRPEPETEKGDKPDEKKKTAPGGDKIPHLVSEIARIAREESKTKREFDAAMASTALTILELGGPGVKAAAAVGIMGIMSGKI